MRDQIIFYPDSLFELIEAVGVSPCLVDLKQKLAARLNKDHHGDFDKWQQALSRLPELTPQNVSLDAAAIQIGSPNQINTQQRESLTELCRQFHPWRKGPFDLFGIYIDTEWRSDWKWDRLYKHITPLNDRVVLDIGCGSGYHCWRMRGAGARFVLGIDPTMVFVMQFLLLQHFIRDDQVQVLPLGIEDLNVNAGCFDTVFSMGLLYHRRDPRSHLDELRNLLRDGGELVLETLVIKDNTPTVLVPDGRYAQMRNVWAIPSVETLLQWLNEAGFRDARCVDVTATTTDEQRVTDWMQFQSLADFLDPQDRSRTVEGYPAPVRAIVIANK